MIPFVRPWMAPLLPLALVLVPALRGRIWFHQDLAHYFYGLRGLLANTWRSGGGPGWTPFVSCGMPLLADIQLAPFYPPNLLFYLMAPGPAFNGYFLFHFLAGTYLAWRFFRRLGCSPWPAAFGTLVFLWGGFFWVHLHHPTFLAAGIWLPGMLEAWNDVIDPRDGQPRAWPRLGFMVAMAALAGGSPQILIYELLVLAAYATFSAMRARGSARRTGHGHRWRVPVLTGAAAVAAGLGCASIQFLPAFFAAREKYRHVLPPMDYSTQFSLSPLACARVLVPNVFGNDFYPFAGHGYQGPSTYWESWFYAGVLTVPLAAFAMRRRGRRGFFSWLLGFGFLASLGKLGGVHGLLAWFLPFYDQFRAPSRWMMIVGFAAAALAAMGLEQVLRSARGEGPERPALERRAIDDSARVVGDAGLLTGLPRLALITLVVGVEIWAVCAMIIFWRDVPLHPVAIVGWLLGLGNLVAAWAYLRWASRASRAGRSAQADWLGPVAVGLLLLDLLPILASYNHTVPAEVALRVPELVKEIRAAAGHGRVLVDRSGPLYLLNGGNEFGYRGVRGYNPMNPARLTRFLEAADHSGPREGGISALVNKVTSPMLDATAARLLVTRKARPARWLKEVYRDPVRRVRVYENTRALPRAFLADQVVVAGDPERVLALSRDALEAFATRRHADVTTRGGEPVAGEIAQRPQSPVVILETDAPPAIHLSPGAAAASSLDWRRDEADEVILEVRAASPVMVVLADTFSAGWSATVDGKPVPIFPAYHAFRAVPVETAGIHEVRFRYETPGLKTGAIVSSLFVLVLCGGWAGDWARRARAR